MAHFASVLRGIVPAEVSQAPSHQPQTPPARPAQQRLPFDNDGLDPRCTLANFIVGTCNQFAFKVAELVASGNARHQVTCLFGGREAGKRHLLHAIGNAVKVRATGRSMVCITAEQLVNEFTSSLRFDRMPAFRERYRTPDLLLVENIGFLVGKPGSEAEFLRTIQALHLAGKEVVCTADVSPFRLGFGEELASYLGELAAELQPLGLDVRQQIVRDLAAEAHVYWQEGLVDFLATNVGGGPRRLQGAVRRLTAESHFGGNPPLLQRQLSVERAEEILEAAGGFLREADISWQRVMTEVARAYGVREGDILRDSNEASLVLPRQVAMYLLHSLVGLSYPRIGKIFPGRRSKPKHHSTVMYSVDKIARERQRNAGLAARLERLEQTLANA